MKPNELMIGDWVMVASCVADAHFVFYPDKVESISKDIVGLESDGLETLLSRIEPIPLTEEILVKNGFEKNDRGDFVIDDTIVIAKENYCPKNYYACTWYQEDFDDEIYYIGICELTFVHQLQHLLRLCGIEKEIELSHLN